jgi:hypothetical protein
MYSYSVTMGNQLTKENTFNLAQLPAAKFDELTNDSYTVIRTSGEEQTGFRIPRAGHYCKEKCVQETVWPAAHAWDSLEDSQTIAAEQAAGDVNPKPFKKWKVHLVKISERPGYNCCEVCGWRTMMPDNGVGAYKNQRTFWPTRLTTPEEREAWWLEMDALLNSLKRTADLSPEEKAAINAADAVRDEEVNGPMRRSRDAEIEKFMREHEQSQRITEAQAEADAEKADMAARHAWWKAFDAEAGELMGVIKAAKEAEGVSPEAAAFYAKSVGDDIMGAKQRDVVAATPPGTPYIWPSGTAIQIWEESERARTHPPPAPYRGFTYYIMDLEKINVWHANRVRRLFDCGFPKAKVIEICQIEDNDARQKRLDQEEATRYLEPMAVTYRW